MGCLALIAAALFALAMLVLTAIGFYGQIMDAQCENGPCPGDVEGAIYQLLGLLGPVGFVLIVIATAAFVIRERRR
jgi:hypothetical protein